MLDWILSCGATVILTSIIMIILPSGKLSAIIKSIFSLVVLLVVISPITKISKGDFSIDNVFTGGEIYVQEEFLHFIAESKIKIYEENCNKILGNFGIENAQLDFEFLITENYSVEVQKLKVDLKKSVINSDKEHIDIIKDVKEALAEYLNVDVGRVEIYE